jgi:hypothetical protein
VPAVKFSYVFHDGESQAGSPAIPIARLVYSEESLENAALMPQRDADPVVGDSKFDVIVV